MKPTKNKIYCYGCRRSKMLFESQAKAKNFIKFNADAIREETGVAPIRIYYCAYCAGYHVTSCESAEIGIKLDKKDQKAIAQIHEQEEKENAIKEELIKNHEAVANKITQAYEYLYIGKFTEAKECLDSISTKINELSEKTLMHGDNSKIRLWWKQAPDKSNAIRSAMSIIEQKSSDKLEPTENNLVNYGISLSDITSNIELLKQIDSIIEQNDQLIPRGGRNEINDNKTVCRTLLQKLVGIGIKKTVHTYNAKLEGQYSQACRIAKSLAPTCEDFGNNTPQIYGDFYKLP